MSKMFVLELTPEMMMDCCLTLANMVNKCKSNPGYLSLVPDVGAEEMVFSILNVIMERNTQQSNGADPAQEKADEEKLEQSVNVAMEALLKAAGK